MSGLKKGLSIVSLATALLFGQVAFATLTEVPMEQLQPDAEQRQTALIITKVVDRFHYRKVPLDDALAADILDRYLLSLDPNRSFFSGEDIAQFAPYRTTLDDALRRADLRPAFRIFRRFRERVTERTAYALALLEANKFDFTRDENYRFNREDAAWEADRAAMDWISARTWLSMMVASRPLG